VEALVRRRTDERPVAGFNLVAACGDEGVCLHYDGTVRPAPLGPGRHVISTDRDLDDQRMPEKRIFDRFFGALADLPDEQTLETFLSSHEGERPVCKHGDLFGTVSSTVYVAGGRETRLLYAGGPPCRTPFTDCSRLL
jgi:hypothetical protein